MGKLSHASARRSGSCEAARPDSNPQLCGCPSRCGPPLLPSSHPQAKHLWRACCVRRGTTPPTRARTGSRSDTSVLTRGAGAAPFAGESSAGPPRPRTPFSHPSPGQSLGTGRARGGGVGTGGMNNAGKGQGGAPPDGGAASASASRPWGRGYGSAGVSLGHSGTPKATAGHCGSPAVCKAVEHLTRALWAPSSPWWVSASRSDS